MAEPLEETNSSITRPASKVMLGGILSLVGGLVSNIVIAAIFGARADMDAYLTAMVIPSYFQLVFYSSLSFILVPAFIEARARHEDEDAWALVGTFFWLAITILMIVTLVCSLFSTEIISITAPGFGESKAAIASRMLAVLIFTTPFTGLGTLAAGIQNARRRFFWPSVAPAFGAFGNMIVLLALYPRIGPMALAWGFLISTIIQSLFTTLPIMLHGWKRTLALTDPRVVSVAKLMLPLILFGMLNSFTPVAERYFSSGLPDGQIAYMGYVSKITGIFVISLASAIATSIFPAMARAYTYGGAEALAEKNNYGLRLSLAVALPVILVITAIAVPLITVIFERGAFGHAVTIGASLIVFPMFLHEILFRMLGNVFQRSFYTLKTPTTQLTVATFFLLVYVAMAGFFVSHWGYVGLVWASTIKKGLINLSSWALLSRKFPSRYHWSVAPYFLKYLLAGLAAYVSARSILGAMEPSPAFVQVVIAGALSGGIYLALLHVLDHEMFVAITELAGVHSLLKKFRSIWRQLAARRA
jgi:putative peptidoglycan lipid II flippase